MSQTFFQTPCPKSRIQTSLRLMILLPQLPADCIIGTCHQAQPEFLCLKHLLHFFIIYLYACMRAMGSQFCPSSIGALRINLGLLGRMASVFPHRALSLALQAVLLIHKNEMLSGCSQNLLPFLLMAVSSPAEMGGVCRYSFNAAHWVQVSYLP